MPRTVVPALHVAVCSLHGGVVAGSVVAGPPREEDVREELVKVGGAGKSGDERLS